MKQDAFVCSRSDCTFSLTGICLESIGDPTRNCPHLKEHMSAFPTEGEINSNDEFEGLADSVRQFSSGLELGFEDIARHMRARYAKLVGVLGQVEAGKTCLFTSLYLQLTGRHLSPEYRFVASDTLLGFEQRARHLRDWSSGGIPDQIVDHTQLGHARSPAFLHVAIRDATGIRHDFLLPDLPGEWTTRLLADASTAERFAFLSRSDTVLIVLEAPKFVNMRTRHNAIADATHLIERLVNDVRLPKFIPIVLAVTKCDETEGKVPSELDRVANLVAAHGYSVSTVALAVFPTSATRVPTGFGIDKLLDHLTSLPDRPVVTLGMKQEGVERSYLRSRGQI